MGKFCPKLTALTPGKLHEDIMKQVTDDAISDAYKPEELTIKNLQYEKISQTLNDVQVQNKL